MASKKALHDLGKRERQILEAVYRRGESAVSDVLADLADPPSYSCVRAIMGMLVRKGVLAYRRDGKRYLYKAVTSKPKAQKSALKNLLVNLFGGRATDAMATLLDVAADDLSDEDFQRMSRMIEQSRKENQ
jgi:BlaI family transcriptional regulator, penicillinase repressor